MNERPNVWKQLQLVSAPLSNIFIFLIQSILALNGFIPDFRSGQRLLRHSVTLAKCKQQLLLTNIGTSYGHELEDYMQQMSAQQWSASWWHLFGREAHCSRSAKSEQHAAFRGADGSWTVASMWWPLFCLSQPTPAMQSNELVVKVNQVKCCALLLNIIEPQVFGSIYNFKSQFGTNNKKTLFWWTFIL